MRTRLVIALAVLASAIAGALIVVLFLGREATEDERAHADTAKRLIAVCNTVHTQLNYTLGVADIERAKDMVLAVAMAIQPCADTNADVKSISTQLAAVLTENGERAALDTAVRATLRLVPYRYDVDEAPK